MQFIGQQPGEILPRIGRGEFNQQVPWGTLGQRVGNPRDVLDRQLDRQLRQKLEGGDLIAGRRT